MGNKIRNLKEDIHFLKEDVERAKVARQESTVRINTLKEAHYLFVDSIHQMIAEREKALWAEVEKHGKVVEEAYRVSEKLKDMEAKLKEAEAKLAELQAKRTTS